MDKDKGLMLQHYIWANWERGGSKQIIFMSFLLHFLNEIFVQMLSEIVARWRYLNILESLKTVVGKEVESDLIWGDVYIGPPPPLRIVFVSLLIW